MEANQQQHEEREVDGIRNLKKTLKEDTFVDTNKEPCLKARRELFSVLVRYTSSEASTIVKSVTGLEGVEAWSNLHANYCRRTMARIFRVQRERTYSKRATHVSHVRLAIMPWEEQWKTVTSEHGQDARITDLWRMSGLLEIRPKEVKEQMLMRLDEIGENDETVIFEQERKSYSCRWKWITSLAASQTVKTGQMCTRFEEDRCATIVGR